MHRLVHQQAIDLGQAVGLQDGIAHLCEMALGADEFAVEEPVHELGRELVPARDQVDQTGGDNDPGPVGHVDVLVDRLDLLVEEEDRHAEQEAERGRASERDPHIDHGRPPHGLDDEQAQDAVYEEEAARDFLGRETRAEQLVERRGLLGELGRANRREDRSGSPR